MSDSILGINEDHEYVDQPYSFNAGQSRLTLLRIEGEEPAARMRCGILSSGAGLVILYGGYDLKGQGNYIDLWHFIVTGNQMQFKEIKYPLDSDNLFMTWRHGFSLHYVRGMQDPVLIGGTFGNNQQSKALVTLPEKKCAGTSDYYEAECSPCPRGSTYHNGGCKWCGHDQYFREHERDYFSSTCNN
jgi:hypothetical protein